MDATVAFLPPGTLSPDSSSRGLLGPTSGAAGLADAGGLLPVGSLSEAGGSYATASATARRVSGGKVLAMLPSLIVREAGFLHIMSRIAHPSQSCPVCFCP
jgi:hypothetical protein